MNKRPSKMVDFTMPLAKRRRVAQDTQQQICPFPTTGTSRLLCLPRELQDMIYDDVAKDGDLSSLLHTCSQLRASALGHLPGADFIDYLHAPDHELLEQIEKQLYICKVNIIAEPWYSSESSLKFEVVWRVLENGVPAGRTQISQWTVRDLSSPMARYFYWYRPDDDVQVIFVPATSGCIIGALTILRWKVFDIIKVLQHIRPKRKGRFARRDLSIHFRGGKDPAGRLRKSFWEMRPVRQYSRKKKLSGSRERHVRDHYTTFKDGPLAYEYLMLPLIFNGQAWIAWRLTFDIEPPNKVTPAMQKLFRYWVGFRHNESDFPGPRFVGPQGLFDAIVSLYIDYRLRTGPCGYLPRGMELMPGSTLIPGFPLDHRDRPLIRPSCANVQWSSDGLAVQLSRGLDVAWFFRGIPCKESEQLRSYLLRMRNAGAPVFAPPVSRGHHIYRPIWMVYEDLWRSYMAMIKVPLERMRRY
ncbi:hypothetical protein DL546_005804 [Coniochaeta pulveracea]|uniref:Uncharacterized protein n=1 Tax=Coniochaeta pulveracea TaxID=177199 RepID=A0A420YC08_9PEZI|nr:hypothetical protein DL546_005804 [Coniochaeta pulveracea]